MPELYTVAVVQQAALIGLQLKAAKTVNGRHGGWVERVDTAIVANLLRLRRLKHGFQNI
jgi:hypothetical protein